MLTLTRTIILYTIVVLTMRIMGKRQIGQLEPFELVIAIMIAELAAVPMEDESIPLSQGIIPILTLLTLQVGISYLALYSQWFRRIIDGVPTVIIAGGRIQEKAMAGARYNMHELLKQLRAKGLHTIADVEFAILETSGDLSVIPKSQQRPVTPADLQINTEYEGLPLPLVVDGVVSKHNLATLGLDEAWLRTELRKHGLFDPARLLLVSLDTSGNLFYQAKETN